MLKTLREALDNSADLWDEWDEWGSASIDIQDGIRARIDALSFLEESSGILSSKLDAKSVAGLLCILDYPTSARYFGKFTEMNRLDTRKEIRAREAIRNQNANGNVRHRKGSPPKDTDLYPIKDGGIEGLDMEKF